jgi:hypothetical protein
MMQQPLQWAYLQQMASWIMNPSTFIFGRWEGHPEGGLEGGMDLISPGGTPVYALASGQVIGAGYFCHGGPYNNPTPACPPGHAPGYGVVTTRISVPGYGTQDLYYQHIDIDPSVRVGQIVQKGQQIGTIRPDVGLLEMGFNAQWGQPWGTSHPGPWFDDPRPLVKALMLDTSPSVAPPSTGLPTNVGENIASLNTLASAFLLKIGVPQPAIDAMNVASTIGGLNVLSAIGIVLVGGPIILLSALFIGLIGG